MKKIFAVLFAVCLISLSLIGCESSTDLKTASIKEITAPKSDNYAVLITYADDTRLDGKGTDVQIKFNNLGTVKIGKENQEKIDYKIEDYDEWYSLTSIFANAEGKQNQEKFELYEDVLNKTYLFNFDGEIKITLRVVAGDIEKNSQETGEILTGSEPISDNFTLKID